MSEVKVEEKSQEEINKEKFQMFVSQIASMKLKDFIKDKDKDTNERFRLYKKEDIINYLNNPAKYEKKLRRISQYLYNTSSHYKRLVDYFSNMHLLRYVLKPINIANVNKVNIKKFKKDYLEISSIIDNMNIEHEFRKIMNICFKEDIFYGYEHSTSKSYFIQQLDSDYCQISSIEDGVYNFAFDFSYFDGQIYKIKNYPNEFLKKYKKYKKDRTLKWQELDSEKTICIKTNENIKYVLPPFIGVFEEVYNIQDYKALKKVKKELENYQLISMKIPMKNEEVNDFTLDLKIAEEFYNKAAETLPDNVGLFLTPMDTQPMKFEQDKIDKDAVVEAEDLFWSSAGVNGNLFNSKGNSGSVVSLSTKTDESIVFALTRQMERWVNRKIKFISKKYDYKFTFLNITINNEKDKNDEMLKLAQYGIPIKMEIAQLNKVSVADMENAIWLENKVFDLSNNLKPLMSSHTMTNDDVKNGKPKKDDENISKEGDSSRDGDAHKSDNLISK